MAAPKYVIGTHLVVGVLHGFMREPRTQASQEGQGACMQGVVSGRVAMVTEYF